MLTEYRFDDLDLREQPAAARAQTGYLTQGGNTCLQTCSPVFSCNTWHCTTTDPCTAGCCQP